MCSRCYVRNIICYLSVVHSEVDDKAQESALCLVANLLRQAAALRHLEQETNCRVDAIRVGNNCGNFVLVIDY